VIFSVTNYWAEQDPETGKCVLRMEPGGIHTEGQAELSNCHDLESIMKMDFPCSEVELYDYCDACHPSGVCYMCDWKPVRVEYWGSYCNEYDTPVVVWSKGGEAQTDNIQEDDLQ